jgi:hypothetical protein
MVLRGREFARWGFCPLGSRAEERFRRGRGPSFRRSLGGRLRTPAGGLVVWMVDLSQSGCYVGGERDQICLRVFGAVSSRPFSITTDSIYISAEYAIIRRYNRLCYNTLQCYNTITGNPWLRCEA